MMAARASAVGHTSRQGAAGIAAGREPDDEMQHRRGERQERAGPRWHRRAVPAGTAQGSHPGLDAQDGDVHVLLPERRPAAAATNECNAIHQSSDVR